MNKRLITIAVIIIAVPALGGLGYWAYRRFAQRNGSEREGDGEQGEGDCDPSGTFETENGITLQAGVPKDLSGLSISASDPAYVCWQKTLPTPKIGQPRAGAITSSICPTTGTFVTKNGVLLFAGVQKNLSGLNVPASDPAYICWQKTLPTPKIGQPRAGKN